MKGDPKVIDYLNEVLKNELTAINQYWLHYRMLDHWGVKKLAEFERHESIDEMKHADWVAERILFLDGLPNFQLLGRLRIGESVEEVLKADLELEYEALTTLRDAIQMEQAWAAQSGELSHRRTKNPRRPNARVGDRGLHAMPPAQTHIPGAAPRWY